MGLPLFVAKVESDLTSKASAKRGVLAPANAGVQPSRSRNRRMQAAEDGLTLREARWQFEQSRLRRDNQRRRTRLGNALIGDSIQVVAAPSPPAQTDLDAVYGSQDDAVDAAMDEFLRLDGQTRATYADSLQDLLGPRWTPDGLRARARILSLRNSRANGNSMADSISPSGDTRSRLAESLGNWTTEPRSQARRARVVSPNLFAEDGLTPEVSFTLRRITQAMQQERRRAESTARDRRAPRPRSTRSQRGIDGLGDRQRSMSPDMWDTLWSTMTPDPEPPSVSSSFTSHPTASQVPTNPSSFSDSRPMDEFSLEPPCDSGCENSDPEEDGPSNNGQAPEGRRRSSGPSDGPVVRRHHTESSEANRSRQVPAASEALANSSSGATDNIQPASGIPRSQYLRVGWVGQLSVGASDETGTRDEGSQETNPQAPHPHNEDDWSGMQLIVRRLARREDIPDEWWLEAGLSRTLGDDAQMQ